MLNYFAGAEVWTDLLLEYGAKNLLFSFYYMKKLDLFKKALDSSQVERIAIDSGAFSFIQGSAKTNLEDFVEQYKAFVEKWADHPKITWLAEMDVDSVVGLKQVKKWFRSLRKISKKVIPIWHPSRGKDDWKKLCEKCDYIGFGTPWRQLPIDVITHLSVYAYLREVKVHGFGCSQMNIMENVPLFSVDSTSYLAGMQYGKVFSGDPFGDAKSFYYQDAERTSSDILQSMSGHNERTGDNIRYFLQLEKSITSLWAKRGITFHEKALKA